MRTIAVESIVTVYSDIMAFILSLGVFFMFRKYHRWKDKTGDSLFSQLFVIVMLNALTNGLSYALHYQETNWPAPVRMLLPTAAEFTVLLTLFVWLLYVDYRLYESRDRIKLVAKAFGIPVLVLLGIFVLNLFTGIVFTVDEHMLFQYRPLFAVMTIAQYFYGILPVAAIIRYRLTCGEIRFFRIMPVVVPVVIASLFTLFTSYSARAFGFAVALVFIHFSSVNKWRFCDSESGFYNRQYLGSLLDLIKRQKRNYKGALCLSVQNPSPEFYGILRLELPKEAEPIRKDRETFLIFTETGNLPELDFMGSVLIEAVEAEEENQNRSVPPIGLSVRVETKKEEEDVMDFVKKLIQN